MVAFAEQLELYPYDPSFSMTPEEWQAIWRSCGEFVASYVAEGEAREAN